MFHVRGFLDTSLREAERTAGIIYLASKHLEIPQEEPEVMEKDT